MDIRQMSRLVRVVVGAVALAFFTCWPASAHHELDPLEAAAQAPASGAPEETIAGYVHRVVIDDRVAGVVVEALSVETDDGRAVALRGAHATGLASGARVEVTGRRNGTTLFVGAVREIARATARASAARAGAADVEVEGRLALLHSDHFDEARSRFIFELHEADGKARALKFPVVPTALHAGMRVVVKGRVAADDAGIDPDSVTVVELAPPAAAQQGDLLKAPVTNNVLVLLMTFTDTSSVPFTQAQVQSVFSGSGGVAAYFSEVSFGQQLINPTVTAWLPTNAATPANCNWQQMGTLGRSAATAAGYNLSSYQNIVYVFPSQSACGWLGLAYIGAGGVWINGRNSTSVYGHELGHNLGLLHAGSLRCSGVAIGGSCSVTEYGDPFNIMGNQSAMHVNATQKLHLGWIDAGTVATHTTGSATYVLSPVETAGGGLYAVKVPAASNRTYWLEYRQPVGFDAGLSGYPNNGVQVRVTAPFEYMCSGCDAYSNETQLLDMTPTTSSFGDAALVVGKSYSDGTNGIGFTVLSATGSALSVQVTAPGGAVATTTTLASSANPAFAGATVAFIATVTGSAPTGTVAFTANGSTIAGCSAVALVASSSNSATAACTTGSLAAGTHAIVARYGGNAGNSASTSATLSQVINAALSPTTTALASNPNPATHGLTVTLTATVSGAAPTGTVRFTDNSVSIPGCSALALSGSGNTRTATCRTTALAVGNHGILASYGGDAANATSGSSLLAQSVVASTTGTVTVDDALPAGAVAAGTGEGWTWVTANPTPYSGAVAHQSALATGIHQHYYSGATPAPIGSNDTLYAYVYLDPANPPSEVMLQWHDGTSWEHRAYWGANSVAWGTDGTASRRYMGALPAAGQWVRLAVPAAMVGLDGKSVTGMAFTLYNGRATWDRAGTDAGAPTTVWVDDAVPTGAVMAGIGEGWNWVASNPGSYSGGAAHQSALAAGLHQHYFFGATATLPVGSNDTLYVYVYLDPANPPSEVMLQWHDGASWEHRAYWGANLVTWGTDGTASRRYMGALPAAGQWVRLAVPAAMVGLDGRTVSGMAFTLYDGRATFDRAGADAGAASAAWIDDGLPAGAVMAGIGEAWNWVSASPAPYSGAVAHQSAVATGVHQHYFFGATTTLSVGSSDTLYAYVYLDPANPPSEVMLQWHDGASWEHRAYWGANLVTWGVDGTASRRYMGALPATGQWVRLAVPATQVGLSGATVSGMAFTLYGGRATWDSAGK